MSTPNLARGAKAYYLDPDYREQGKYQRDKNGPMCVRCQQVVDPAKCVRVTVNYETMLVTEGGEDLMGQNCWKEISK